MKTKKEYPILLGNSNKKIIIEGIGFGRFETKEEAVLAYNKKAKQIWRNFISLNQNIKVEETK